MGAWSVRRIALWACSIRPLSGPRREVHLVSWSGSRLPWGTDGTVGACRG